SDKYLFKDDGVFYRTVNDTSASDNAVLHDRTRIVFCRRLVAHLGLYTRKLSEKVIPHLRLQEIHVCPVICIHSRYVAPIAAYLVPVYLFQILVPNQNIIYKIMSFFFRTVFYQIDELSPADDINAGGDSLGMRDHRLFF